MQTHKCTNEYMALTLASFIFALVGVVHIWRLFTHFPIIIGSYAMPLWPSLVAAVITLGLALWLSYLVIHLSKTDSN